MAAKDRDTHGRGRDPERRFAQNFPGLVDHFQLFLGVTAIREDIDVGNAVEGDLMRELFLFDFLSVEKSGNLMTKLLHRLPTRS